ncbi:MAG: hypothetical protein ACOCNU_03590 [Bacteroidales bacterium]
MLRQYGTLLLLFCLCAALQASDGGTKRSRGTTPGDDGLTGTGWTGYLKITEPLTADELAAKDLGGVTCLDLSGISLPEGATAFRHTPVEPNLLIYVRSEDANRVPEAWRFAVARAENGEARLLHSFELTDGAPLFIPFPFAVSTGQLRYTRRLIADGNWQTLCLPFDADAVEGQGLFEAGKALGMDGAALAFGETETIAGGAAHILRTVGTAATDGRLTVTFSSRACTVAPTLGYLYQGIWGTNYRQMAVADANESIYLLTADGSTFAHAAAGSTLAPFRCYLSLFEPVGPQLVIRFERNTAAALPHAIALPKGNGKAQPIYDLAGRRRTGTARRGEILIMKNMKLVNK